MKDFSLIEKFNILMELISSSSLFLVVSMIGIAVLIFIIICIIKNQKINKKIFIITFSLIGFIILINYNVVIFKVLDIIIDSVFKFLYFPNLPMYIAILLIINIIFIISMFDKRSKLKKIINSITTVIFDILFILIISVVSKNNINIYEEINLYTNSTLLVLLELSTGTFTSWILINLFVSAHNKLKKFDKKEYPKLQEIIFD